MDAGASDNEMVETTAIGSAQKRAKRAKLSCLECRKRKVGLPCHRSQVIIFLQTSNRLKLACDRNLPCRRCVRTQRAAQCSFEDGPRFPAATLANRQGRDEGVSRQIVQLQDNVSQLRAALAQVQDRLNKDSRTHDWSGIGASEDLQLARHIEDHAQPSIAQSTHDIHPEKATDGLVRNDVSLIDPSVRFPQMYYTRHFLFSFLNEVRFRSWSDSHLLTFLDEGLVADDERNRR